MKKFIGIGIGHGEDFLTPVNKILSDHSPSALSLEQRGLAINFFECTDDPRIEERVRRLMAEAQVFTAIDDGRLVTLKTMDLQLLGYQPLGSYQPYEYYGALRWALQNRVPFYFTDWSSYFRDCILEFKDGKVKPMYLGDVVRYDTATLLHIGGKPFIGATAVLQRNQFTAGAINFLLGRHGAVAHIGGNGHYDSRIHSKYITHPLDEETELQALVEADEKVVYDLVLNTKKIKQINCSA